MNWPRLLGRVLVVGFALALLSMAVVVALVTWPMRAAVRIAAQPARGGSQWPKGWTLAALIEGALALGLGAFGLQRQRGRRGPAWHPCEQCGAPIDTPSRAAFCSVACRETAQVRRRQAAFVAGPGMDEVPY